jgi:hypothetical protein
MSPRARGLLMLVSRANVARFVGSGEITRENAAAGAHERALPRTGTVHATRLLFSSGVPAGLAQPEKLGFKTVKHQRRIETMRKLTLLAICALVLAQSSPALATLFFGNYACRASGSDYGLINSPPVMFLSSGNGYNFSGGTLIFYHLGTLCKYSLVTSESSFTIVPGTGSGTGTLTWGTLVEDAFVDSPSCPSSPSENIGFVLSGSPNAYVNASVVQMTDTYTSYECTFQP